MSVSGVREEMDRIVGTGGFEGVTAFIQNRYPGVSVVGGPGDWREELIRNDARRVGVEVARVLEYLKALGPEKGMHSAEAMLRYALEGDEGTYVPDAGFREFLLGRFGSQGASGGLLDLGCGNVGQYLHQWDRARGLPRGTSKGVDLSPSFALRGGHKNISVGAIDAPTAELRHQTILPLKPAAVSVSSLTLDRLYNPAQAIRNLHDLTAAGGRVVVASLFPIVPEDDEPGLTRRIVYTPEVNRLTNTGTLDGDLRQLTERISDELSVSATADTYQYTVQSSGGPQVYENFRVLSWAKSAQK
jgi:SAM-dependent methyltransferase